MILLLQKLLKKKKKTIGSNIKIFVNNLHGNLFSRKVNF